MSLLNPSFFWAHANFGYRLFLALSIDVWIASLGGKSAASGDFSIYFHILDTNPSTSTWHVRRQGPTPRMVLLCKLLIVSSSIFSILAFATDDDILDTSIY
jgi:hypothetical protein